MGDLIARGMASQALAGFTKPESFGASPTTTPTQNVSAIQQALNIGGHVYLGTPGIYQINAPLSIANNTHFELGKNVTIQLAPNSACNMLVNSQVSSPATPNVNIKISGGTWDFNGNNQGIGTASWSNSIAIVMNGVNKLTIEDISVLNAWKYAFLVATITDLTTNNLWFNTLSDGFHLQAPITRAHIRNHKGTTGDDFLAFTIMDYAAYVLPGNTGGAFTDISVDGLYPMNGATTAVKFAGVAGAGNVFDSITIENVMGSVQQSGIYFQDDAGMDGTAQTNINDVFIRNVKLQVGATSPVVFLRCDTLVNFKLENVDQINGTQIILFDQTTNCQNAELRNLNSTFQNTYPIVSITSQTGTPAKFATVGKLLLDGGQFSMGSATNTLTMIMQVQGTVTVMELSNIEVTYPASLASGATGDVITHQNNGAVVVGTIGTLRVKNVGMTNGTHFYNQTSNSVSSVNILADALKISGIPTAFQIRSSAEICISKPLLSSVSNPVYVSSGTLTLIGDGIEYSGRFVTVSSGTVYVKGLGLQADVSQLTQRNGDFCFNQNSGLSCGVGLCVSNGTQWTNLFTGASYPSATTFAGTTAGNVYYQMQNKKFVAVFSGYENNSVTNQTITFPTAFTYTPDVSVNTTGLTVSATTTTLTITAPNNTTLFNGVVEVIGI